MKKMNILIFCFILNISYLLNQEQQVDEIPKYSIFPLIGQISPLGENLRTYYDAGYSVGLGVDTPLSFTLFKKNWNLGASINYSILNHHKNDFKSFKYLSISPLITTNFNQLLFRLGIGFTSITAEHLNKEFLSGSLDIGYNIFSKDDFNIILNIHFQEILGNPNYNVAKGTSELYGVNLEFSQGL